MLRAVGTDGVLRRLSLLALSLLAAGELLLPPVFACSPADLAALFFFAAAVFFAVFAVAAAVAPAEACAGSLLPGNSRQATNATP